MHLVLKLDSGLHLLQMNDPHLRFWRTWQVCNFLLRSSPSSAKLFLFSFLFYPKNFVRDIQIANTSYGCFYAHQWSFSQGSKVCNPPHCPFLCFLQNRDVSLFKSSASEFCRKTPPSSPWSSSHRGTAWSQHFSPEEHQDWSANQSVSMTKDLANEGCSTSFYRHMFTSIQQLVIVAHLNVWWLMMIYLKGFCLCEILEIVVGCWGGEKFAKFDFVRKVFFLPAGSIGNSGGRLGWGKRAWNDRKQRAPPPPEMLSVDKE